MRNAVAADLAGYDAMLCLAALSNGPLGDLNPPATQPFPPPGKLNSQKETSARPGPGHKARV
jgi:hypothetical protein